MYSAKMVLGVATLMWENMMNKWKQRDQQHISICANETKHAAKQNAADVTCFAYPDKQTKTMELTHILVRNACTMSVWSYVPNRLICWHGNVYVYVYSVSVSVDIVEAIGTMHIPLSVMGCVLQALPHRFIVGEYCSQKKRFCELQSLGQRHAEHLKQRIQIAFNFSSSCTSRRVDVCSSRSHSRSFVGVLQHFLTCRGSTLGIG